MCMLVPSLPTSVRIGQCSNCCSVTTGLGCAGMWTNGTKNVLTAQGAGSSPLVKKVSFKKCSPEHRWISWPLISCLDSL